MGVLTRAFQTVLESRLPASLQSDVLIKHPREVGAILQRLMQDGPDSLQVISDFDYTISRFSHHGHPCDSTYRKSRLFCRFS